LYRNPTIKLPVSTIWKYISPNTAVESPEVPPCGRQCIEHRGIRRARTAHLAADEVERVFDDVVVAVAGGFP
jgi:hypothetical protein